MNKLEKMAKAHAETRCDFPYVEAAFKAGAMAMIEMLESDECSDELRDVHNVQDLKCGIYCAQWLESECAKEIE